MLIKTHRGYLSTDHIVSYDVNHNVDTGFFIVANTTARTQYEIGNGRYETSKQAFQALDELVSSINTTIIYNQSEESK